jgi:DNA-binding response OmpR family regulator
MRRSITVVGAELKVLDLRLDCSKHRVMRGTNEVVLSPQEFALLEFLMRNEQKIFSADDLIKKVWRGDASNATVRTHIKTLRKKVDANELVPLLQTIHGVGYCISQTSFDH